LWGRLTACGGLPGRPAAKRDTLEPVRQLPAILAFALLCLQVALPWTAPHFVTQDGPSHLYGSVVARDLLINPHSPYRAVYALQRRPIPNWTSTVLLAAFASVVGQAHAEQLLVSFLMLFGFFAFSYASASFDPGPTRWSPLANVLLQTYFLTRGYCNLQLGMAFGLIVLGYATRRLDSFKPTQAAILALGWIALFFTHLLPAAPAMMAVLIMAAWVHLPRLLRSPKERLAAFSHLALLGASSVPVLLLVLAYANMRPGAYPSNALTALRSFPMYVFSVSSGRAGHQAYLFPILFCLVIVAIAFMKAPHWTSARGGLLLATFASFCLYVFVPNVGFGVGGDIKVRVAWAVLLFAGVTASSVPLPRAIWLGFSLCFAIATLACLIAIMRVNGRACRFADGYRSVLNVIPAGSTVVRLRYPAPVNSARFGIPSDLLFLPLLHTDSFVAAERGCIELSNYEAAARVFPIVFQPRFSPEQQWLLWTLDNPENDGAKTLKRLRETLPTSVDYYVLLGEDSVPGVPQVTKDLESAGNRLVKSAGDPPYARLYR